MRSPNTVLKVFAKRDLLIFSTRDMETNDKVFGEDITLLSLLPKEELLTFKDNNMFNK